MDNILKLLFGEGEDLSILNMSCRAFIMFFIALLLLRISGRRSFGARSPFDNIVVIMLGAILSRPIVGASSFIPTVVAATVICVVHRLLAILAARIHPLSKILKGGEGILYKDGQLNYSTMKRFNLSLGDVEEGVRTKAGTSSLSDVKEIWIERSGELSVIR